ncbi:unnamed protein product [Urochloa decumbens]|uniref:Uncharacterized protein n=1 Tax=Urochloa decumbens TaxID=240449 RepID=A0ABC8W141_9POAL
MCSLAPPPTTLGLGFHAGVHACLDRRRGVHAAVVAPAACGVMAREPVRRAGAAVSSAVPAQKRSREAPFVPAPGQQRELQQRMREELDAIRVLQKKAVLLSRSAVPSSKSKDDAAAGARSVALMEVVAKRRKASQLKRAPEAAQQSTELEKKQKQQRPVVQRAKPLPTESEPSVAKLLDKAREILERRRLEEMAQAREKFRQEVLEMEKAAMPDETVYPRDLQELGIAFEYAVTRTRRQAGCVPG